MTPRVDGRRRRAPRVLVALPLLLSQILLPGCGKKGPPLAPLVRIPARVEPFEARRFGSVVYIEMKVPALNQDGSPPANIARLEIYGYTGEPPSMEVLLKHGTLVASLHVRRPPEPEPPPASGRSGRAATAPPKAPAAPARVEAGVDQGAIVVVTEKLSPELLKPIVLPAAARFTIPPTPRVSPPALGPPSTGVTSRTYVAVAYSRNGKKNAPSARAVVPVVQAPQPPTDLALTYTADRIRLGWKPPATLRRPAQEPAAGGVLQAVPLMEVLPGTTYSVYEASRPASAAAPASAPAPHSEVRMPTPLNDSPLASPAFDDPRFAFGVERCYVVRTIDAFGAGEIVASEPSVPACVTPKDTFPPAAPRSLQAVAGDKAISLIWEPNAEADLAGYLVLRAIAPGGTLERLTPGPIRETTYNDATVSPGVRYIYAVVAVDSAAPPNASPTSNKVEVVAR